MSNQYNINLEDKYNKRKGIYVLTYTGKKPYKIGMTNTAIPKRINSYVNCPSQHDGHYIHLLLTWNISADLSAKTVESFIFNKLASYRMNSTQRKMAFKTEHFDVPLSSIESAMEEAKKHYKNTKSMTMYLDKPKEASVKVSNVVGKRNVIMKSV